MVTKIAASFLLILTIVYFSSFGAFAEDTKTPAPNSPYERDSISQARFGDTLKQERLKKAHSLKDEILKRITGQERVAQILQDRLVQYVEGWGTRTKDPVALHMIGLPGVGKTAILDVLEELGFKVIRVDAQILNNEDHVKETVHSTMNQVSSEETRQPTILLLDELDKIREVKTRAGFQEEETKGAIGAFLNQLLTDGKVNNPYNSNRRFSGSNTFVITAMNFAPEEIQRFSKEALGNDKNYYDFTAEDFERFDTWLRSYPSAVAKVLATLFRSNTVSRLAPNTVIVEPLSEVDFKEVARIQLQKTIRELTEGASAHKRITATFTEELIGFLGKHCTSPPLGARDTVSRVDVLGSQMIFFGTKFRDAAETLDRPRHIVMDYDPAADQVILRVTPKILHKGKLEDGESFNVPLKFDADARAFLEPAGIAISPPAATHKKREAEQLAPPTRKQIVQTRFPDRIRGEKKATGLAKYINSTIYGQEDTAQHFEEEMSRFMRRKPDAFVKSPSFTVLAGFPGIGKSEMINKISEFTGLPVARINMQGFGSDSPDAVGNFADHLENEISRARMDSKNGKILLAIEEFDKVFEIHPQNGAFVPRPVMNILKDLLDKSAASANADRRSWNLEIADVYPILTMNFAVERFGFSADPRLTTIEDVMAAWKKLSTRPADRKNLLQSMFLPETVSRIFDKTRILKPLGRGDYKKVIIDQINIALKERFYDPASKRDLGQIQIELTDNYKRYLFSESVIPSEGARNTATASRRMIARDLEFALQSISKSSPLAHEPLTLILDYKPGKTKVTVSVVPTAQYNKEQPRPLTERDIFLTFPPLNTKGKIEPFRLLVAVHEFGHALSSIRLGGRIEYATVVPPQNGTGGYVKHKNSDASFTAKGMIVNLYSTIASRAMERIFLSENPLEERSVLNITPGSSSDILQTTQTLWEFLYEYGLDPQGGVMDRRGATPMGPYAKFSDLSPETVEALGWVIKDMENFFVKEFLAAHSFEWYREKIVAFARAGGLNEREFYKLIDYPYPGNNLENVGEISRLYEVFADVIKSPSKEVTESRKFGQGNSQTTARENLEKAVESFVNSVQERLHPSQHTGPQANGEMIRARVLKKLPVRLDCEGLFAI